MLNISLPQLPLMFLAAADEVKLMINFLESSDLVDTDSTVEPFDVDDVTSLADRKLITEAEESSGFSDLDSVNDSLIEDSDLLRSFDSCSRLYLLGLTSTILSLLRE